MYGSHAGVSGIPTAVNLLHSSSELKPPKFSNGGMDLGSIIVEHREYLTDLYGNDTTALSTAKYFVNQTRPINPGLEATFPWLSQLGVNFDEYEMLQLRFEFESTVSPDPNTNGQVGTIVMCTDYNASAPPFTDKSTMMQYAGACSAKVTENLHHYVECMPSQNSGSAGKYVRNQPVLTNQNLKDYDLGTYQCAVSGTPSAFAGQSIGQLWVTYKVLLRKPKLYAGSGLAISRDVFSAILSSTLTKISTGNIIISPLPALGAFGLPGTILSGQQNSIPCTLEALTPFDYDPNQTGVTLSNVYQLTFPSNAVGFYEIFLATKFAVFDTNTPGGATYPIQINGKVIKTGDNTAIVPVNDFSYPQTSPNSGAVISASQVLGDGNQYVTWTIHVQCFPQYGGQDKFILFNLNDIVLGPVDPPTGNSLYFDPLTCWVSVTEYNPMGNPGNVPVMLNQSGVVTQPSLFTPT